MYRSKYADTVVFVNDLNITASNALYQRLKKKNPDPYAL